MKPLENVLVLDFSTLLPGPLATLMLAEAGAEVVKIERPGAGDEMRLHGPCFDKDSAAFALLNRGKKSIALDLKDQAARRQLDPLLGRADVLVEQFRPGVMDRLGLSYEAVRRMNPGIIYCSITGYGQRGPRHQEAGHDLNYMASTGLLSLSCGEPDHPTLPPVLAGDIAGGTYPAVLNILLALMERSRHGQGCHLDISMTDNLFTLAFWAIGQGVTTAQWPGNGEGWVTGGSPRYNLYPTQDGRLAAVAAIEDRFWNKFCETLGLSDDACDDSTDPRAKILQIRDVVKTKPSGYWREVFAEADCCCSIVSSLEEAMADPHFASRGIFAHTTGATDGTRIPALPVPIVPHFRIDAANLQAPALGGHNGELLKATDCAPAAVTERGK